MKKNIFIIIIFIILTGCSSKVTEVNEQIVRRVETTAVVRENYIPHEVYIGTIIGSDIIKQSFGVSGKIKSIVVKKGDEVKKGEKLATIDLEGMNLDLSAATSDYALAKSKYSKAKDSNIYLEKLFSDTKKLYEAGLISKDELDKVQFNYEISSTDVISAKELVEKARINLKSKEYLIKNSIIYAEEDGVVVDVLNKKGEMIQEGYPVIILRDKFPIASFGVSQKSLEYLKKDMILDIIYNDRSLQGKIDLISQVPDQATQTYEVQIKISEDIPLGSIFKVKIPTKEIIGYKVPITSIKSDGDDYIYIVKKDSVDRVNINIIDIINENVIVTGLEDDYKIIIKGMSSVRPGDKVIEE